MAGGEIRSIGMAFLAIALIGLTAQSQPAPTQARAAMLDRFVTVLPRPDSDPNSERAQRDEAKRRLAGLNPGNEAASGEAFDTYADCLKQAMNTAAPILARQAADQSLSDAELADFVEFYSGPRYQAYLRLAERRARDEQLTTDERQAVRAVEEAPASRRFTAALGQTSAGFANSPDGQRVMAPCVAELRARIEANGLHWF